jgi:hypothetical protein
MESKVALLAACLELCAATLEFSHGAGLSEHIRAHVYAAQVEQAATPAIVTRRHD